MKHIEIVNTLSQNYHIHSDLITVPEDDIIALMENKNDVLNYLKTSSKEDNYRFILNSIDLMSFVPKSETELLISSLITDLLTNEYFNQFRDAIFDYTSENFDKITDPDLLNFIKKAEGVDDIKDLTKEPAEKDKLYSEMLDKFFDELLTPEDIEYYKSVIPDSALFLDEYPSYKQSWEEIKNRPEPVLDENLVTLIKNLFEFESGERKIDQNGKMILIENFPKFKNIIEDLCKN